MKCFLIIIWIQTKTIWNGPVSDLGPELKLDAFYIE